MRCIEVESEHLRKNDSITSLFGKISSLPEKLFGRAISFEDLLLIGLIILLFMERRREKKRKSRRRINLHPPAVFWGWVP